MGIEDMKNSNQVRVQQYNTAFEITGQPLEFSFLLLSGHYAR